MKTAIKGTLFEIRNPNDIEDEAALYRWTIEFRTYFICSKTEFESYEKCKKSLQNFAETYLDAKLKIVHDWQTNLEFLA